MLKKYLKISNDNEIFNNDDKKFSLTNFIRSFFLL